jgi:hypothetical protein
MLNDGRRVADNAGQAVGGKENLSQSFLRGTEEELTEASLSSPTSQATVCRTDTLAG